MSKNTHFRLEINTKRDTLKSDNNTFMAEAWYLRHIRELENKLKKAEGELKQEKDKREATEKENEELKDQLEKMARAKESKRPKFPDYSLKKHEKNINKGKIKKSTGRIPFKEKLKTVQFEKDVYPEGIPHEKCVLRSKRIVTHLKNGKKEVWLYRIYRQSWGKATGKLPHVYGKSEYGVEVVMALAFLVYVLKLSQDQTIKVLMFFTGIDMQKSEIETLFNQLGKTWKKEFETLSDLMLLALLVHVDETGWKVGKKNCYTWIFRSLEHTLLLYGEKRDEDVLDRILPRGKFKGTGITDCYKIYEKYFFTAQKCWAHFLRKALKLMLVFPKKQKYRKFFKKLYDIFLEAKKLKENPCEKEKGIMELEEEIQKICTLKNKKLGKRTAKDFREFVNLQKNLVRNIKDLFTFVRKPEVDPTNNFAEQGLRHVAKSRNNYQTSKTQKGANRHSIIASVLFSLKQNLKNFSLAGVTAEVLKWQMEGKSLFQKQLENRTTTVLV